MSSSSSPLITSFCSDPVYGRVYRNLSIGGLGSWFEADQLYSTINLTIDRDTLEALLTRPATEAAKEQAIDCISNIRKAESNLVEPLPGKTSQEYALALASWSAKKAAKASNVFAALADDSDDGE
jgi:hypothetical protein